MKSIESSTTLPLNVIGTFGMRGLAVGGFSPRLYIRLISHPNRVPFSYPSTLNYNQFPKSLCISVNEVVCHGIPDFYEVQDGDIVNLDISVYNSGGYHSDLNETLCIGNVDDEGRRVVRTAFECLQAAVAMVRPGTLYRDLGGTIERVAKQNRFVMCLVFLSVLSLSLYLANLIVNYWSRCSVVRSFCGHGIGSLFHAIPTIPHYAKNKAKGTMKAGHVFTIEPMINLGGAHDKIWDDNWTVVTVDGKRSAQFEHTLLVTEMGCEILTARENEPVMVWDPTLIDRH
jgi:methionyl aminopeptidase